MTVQLQSSERPARVRMFGLLELTLGEARRRPRGGDDG